MATINLSLRYKQAFGYVTVNAGASISADLFTGGNVNIYNSDSRFEEFTLIRNESEKMKFGSLLFPGTETEVFAPPPMISFKKSKNLVITEIDGSSAEVVERYGDKSWEIKIQGLLIDTVNHIYPKQKVVQLRRYFDLNAPFAIEGDFFEDLNIKSIYFTDFEMSGVNGFADTVQYTISARSIQPVQFFFSKNNN